MVNGDFVGLRIAMRETDYFSRNIAPTLVLLAKVLTVYILFFVLPGIDKF
jgi:hypothetical protein